MDANRPSSQISIDVYKRQLLDKSTMGKDHIPDMLALTYYAGNYAHKSVQECAMEMQDTYVRLDRSIASLLDIIDKKVGLQNVVFFITSTGYTDTESPDLGPVSYTHLLQTLNIYISNKFPKPVTIIIISRIRLYTRIYMK